MKYCFSAVLIVRLINIKINPQKHKITKILQKSKCTFERRRRRKQIGFLYNYDVNPFPNTNQIVQAVFSFVVVVLWGFLIVFVVVFCFVFLFCYLHVCIFVLFRFVLLFLFVFVWCGVSGSVYLFICQ